MKHIRMFESAEQAAAILPTLEYNTLSAIRGENGISMNPGASPTPPTPVVDPTIPFYIENISNETGKIYISKASSSAPSITIEKSSDNLTWTTAGSTSSEIQISISSNDKIYLRCNTSRWCATNNGYYNSIFCNKPHKVGGNINSLLYGSSFTNQTILPDNVQTYTFCSLFRNNTQLTDASDLLLPNNLINICYSNMFYGCTSLTTAPALPATTLVGGCYNSMFYGCTALTTAPELPATTLVSGCYYSMFNGCSQLNHIKCLATDISASNCTNSWVNGVTSSGTFVKDPNMSDWTTGNNGIPSDWTVEDAV